jgi:tripartite-type tricarboxylate transporter receptor subunit TctC
MIKTTSKPGSAGRAPVIHRALIAALALIAPTAVQAQPDFYAGKRITIAVGASPGGGYDLYARAVAPFLGEHIPGKPTVVVQNMPGAGSLTSVLYLDSTAPKDGTAITIFNAGIITDTATNPAGAKVDLATMAWLGSVTRTHRICYFWHGSGIKSFDDLGRTKTVTLGAIGVGSGSYNDIAILKNLMKRNVRGVLGYPGRSEVHLAIERGELDGECGAIDGLPENWVRDKKITILVRLSDGKSPAIPDGVPWMGEFIKSNEDLQVYRLLTVANELGRPFIASRHVPPERLAILRKAFETTMKDKNFIAAAEKRQLSLDFVDGTTAQEMIVKLAGTPQALRARARDIIK